MPAGRPRRSAGCVVILDGVTFTFEGGRQWTCGACLAGLVVPEADAAGRKHARTLQRHLAECSPSNPELLAVSRLVPVFGPHFFFVSDALSDDVVGKGCAEASSLTPWSSVGVVDAPDTRVQHRFTVGAGDREWLSDLVRLIVGALSEGWPGYVVRGGHAYVLQGGLQTQFCHVDWHTDRAGATAADSLTVFAPLSSTGRRFGLVTGAGIARHYLPPRSVAVLSAGAYHCGLSQEGMVNPVLFFYADRVGTIGCAPSESSVSPVLWDDLAPDVRSAYCCREQRLSSFSALAQQLRVCFQEAPGRAARRKRRQESVQGC